MAVTAEILLADGRRDFFRGITLQLFSQESTCDMQSYLFFQICADAHLVKLSPTLYNKKVHIISGRRVLLCAG